MTCRRRETVGFIEIDDKKSHGSAFLDGAIAGEEKLGYCFCRSSFKGKSFGAEKHNQLPFSPKCFPSERDGS